MKGVWMVVAALVLGGCASLQYGTPQATAELKDAGGKAVGRVRLWESADGVRILARVRELPPGQHGIHLHAIGKCDPPDFSTAGGHFNPAGRQHGLKNPGGPHAGDLPNLDIAADGRGGLDHVTRLVTLAPGPTSLFGPQGTAVVIHANPDDAVTDPSGSSGGRIACGVLNR
ncbi:MAG TPA: superoxide dismutase family protein [Candidatus Methylomirabilis sp.]|nr:superoxide dismutase family protein [Candidatus Methylomirabilis sp.]